MIVFSKKPSGDLLDGFEIDAPYVTEVRRLLQNLARRHGSTKVDERAYMVTSASRDEGKSTTSALLAIVAARIFHRRTLLIDGDLRRPTIHTLLHVSRGPGLREILQGTISIADATRPTALPLLSVIPRGHSIVSPSEAYSDEAFGSLIRTARAKYDQIFVDAAPVVPVMEPILMAEHLDAILVVAMAGRTPITAIRRSMQILAPVASKIAGVVLNNAMEGLPYYYDYRYYGYKERKPTPTPLGPPDASEGRGQDAPADDRDIEGDH